MATKKRVPWNKGLTKDDPRVRKNIKRAKETIKKQYETGRKPWNSGLTKETDERVKINIEKRNKTMHEKNLWSLDKNPRWKGGKAIYNKLALEHYGKNCQECGIYDDRLKKMHVHHIDHDRLNNKLDNLMVLCAKCHKAKHPQKATEHQKRIASKTHKGKPKSEEQKKKMSEARKLWWKKKKR